MRDWYRLAYNPETGEVISEKLMRAKEIVDNQEFWLNLMEKTNFSKFIKDSFTIGASGSIMRDEDEVIDDNDEALAS